MSTIMDNIEKSIHAYKLETSLDFDEIKNIINYVKDVRNNNPENVLLNIGEMTRYLFLSINGSDIYDNVEVIWLKLGWARRELPEALNTRTGRVEALKLGNDVYLFEPSHFLLFRHDKDILMLYEYNMFAPRPLRLCQYMEEFYKKMKNDFNIKIRIFPRRLFMRDVEKLLRNFDVVTSIRIEGTSSIYKISTKFFGESKTAVEALFKKYDSKYVSITWKSNIELNVTIDEIIDVFHELEPWLRSFVVTVKKGFFKRPIKIDLKKYILAFRKPIKLARDEAGNLLRTTDTNDAINALKSVISEVINQL